MVQYTFQFAMALHIFCSTRKLLVVFLTWNFWQMYKSDYLRPPWDWVSSLTDIIHTENRTSWVLSVHPSLLLYAASFQLWLFSYGRALKQRLRLKALVDSYFANLLSHWLQIATRKFQWKIWLFHHNNFNSFLFFHFDIFHCFLLHFCTNKLITPSISRNISK